MCDVMKASDNAIKLAAEAVAKGKLVAFPTDTVYGVGASIRLVDAVLRLYRAKSRPRDKAIPVLIAHASELPSVAVDVPPEALRLSERFWPGPLTIVLRKSSAVPPEVTAGQETVAVRVPDHEVALELLRLAGPMAVTSANISGAAPPLTAEGVVSQLCERIDLVLDGGRCPGGTPSTIVDLSGDEPSILRSGPISPEKIFRVFHK